MYLATLFDKVCDAPYLVRCIIERAINQIKKLKLSGTFLTRSYLMDNVVIVVTVWDILALRCHGEIFFSTGLNRTISSG